MKKAVIIAAVGGASFALVAVIALAVAGFAYAQAGSTPVPGSGSYGPGRMGGRGVGMMGGGRMGGMMGGRWANGVYGPMHEYMIAALADGLGLTAGELQEQIDNGETPYQVAVSQGLSAEEIQTLFQTAHTEALQAAVEAGAITQEQADFMNERMGSMWANGGFGCRGGGARWGGSRWGGSSSPTPTP